MGCPFDACLRWRVVWAVMLDGIDLVKIPDTPLRVSLRTAQRIIGCFKAHRDVWPPSHFLARRPRRQMTEEDDRVLIRMLVSSPESMLKEHFREFCGRTGCLMHVSTFCRAVKRLGYTRKKLEAYAQRRDLQASNRFLAFVLGTLSVDQLFFLDEAAKDTRDLRRCALFSAPATLPLERVPPGVQWLGLCAAGSVGRRRRGLLGPRLPHVDAGDL